MQELILGVTMGFSAGISPGPLFALVISATLRGGRASGFLVAASPLLTDRPIIVLTLTFLSKVPLWVLAVAGITGAAFVLKIGISTLLDARHALPPTEAGDAPGGSLRQGVIVNALSPHPWLFWLSVGGPLLITAWHRGTIYGGVFLVGFYSLLVGSKVVLALLIGSVRHRLNLSWYRRLLGTSGCLLLFAAAALIIEFVPRLAH